MKTLVNNQNSERMNGESQVINYTFEIVRDFDGTYYANVHNELHEHFRGLPEYVTYKELKKAVKEALGVTLPALIDLHFEKSGRKRYAQVYDLQGVRVEQPAMAFSLQDKVVLGAFGERRYAIGCIVTGYKWDVATGQFLYILQGEDGQQYTDFERNIIADKGEEPTLETASEITDGEAVGVLHYGTMVRMPGVVGGLKVAEIDREGDRVICKSDGEQHEYKSIAYFEQTAQEIIIPRWLRIMKYFYIGPKDKEENRVLCTAIEPNNDPEHPVVIHYNVDGEDEDSKIVLTSGLDYYNRENPTDPDGSGKPTLESSSEITATTMPEWVKNGQKVIYKGETCVIECAPDERYQHMGECLICTSQNRVFFVKWAELEPVIEPFFSPGTRYRCIKAVKGCFTVGNIYDQSSEATRWHGYLRNDKGEMHCWPQIDEIAHSSELFNMKPEDADPRLYFEPVAA